ncbi:MAG: outer membrane protein transport protein [Thermodesulfobacteriota bacterium]|nr:outer membrane protein transport protein [Thermodesulfobacteriota bacterium]
MRLKRWVIIFSFLFFLFFTCTGSWAVVVGPDILGTDFRFNNPGARANAMGGAFIGLADDATAAYTNPAGLTILTEPEFSVEYKVVEITTHFQDQVSNKEFDDTVSGLSFLSYVYPAENATFALFRHQLLNTETNFTWEDSAAEPQKLNVSLDAVTLGIGAGFKLTDTFSLGLSIGMAQLDYDVNSKRYDSTQPPYPDAREWESISETDNAEHYTVSLLWSPLEALNIGLVYRMGPEFETVKQRYSYVAGGYYGLGWEHEHILKIPDVYGLGFSFRFLSNLTATLDVNYIEYSDLADDFINDQGVKDRNWEVDDEFEVRVGLEYIIDINETPVALRGGYYYRPDHRLYYDGTDDADLLRLFGEPGDDDDHIFSLGFGVVLTEKFQLDLAAGAGQYIKEGSLSMVYRF